MALTPERDPTAPDPSKFDIDASVDALTATLETELNSLISGAEADIQGLVNEIVPMLSIAVATGNTALEGELEAQLRMLVEIHENAAIRSGWSIIRSLSSVALSGLFAGLRALGGA